MHLLISISYFCSSVCIFHCFLDSRCNKNFIHHMSSHFHATIRLEFRSANRLASLSIFRFALCCRKLCDFFFTASHFFSPAYEKEILFSGVPRTKTKGYKPHRLSTKGDRGSGNLVFFLFFFSFSSASFFTLYLPRLTEVIGSSTQGRESSITTKTPKKKQLQKKKKKKKSHHQPQRYIYLLFLRRECG